ncbi:MAG: serine--tRNA ligase [archaeon]|nr:serine--tRNA ligase [archaeon]
MLDIDLIRKQPDLVQGAVKNRGYDIDIKAFLKLDEEWKTIKSQEDELRNKRNILTKQLGLRDLDKKKREQILKEAKAIPAKLEKIETKANELNEKRKNILERIPNIANESVPIGGEENFKIVKEHGKVPKFDFPAKQHYELGEKLGIIDMERGAKIAGSGFYVFKGAGSKLERALINFFLDFNSKNGFTEWSLPYLVNKQTAFGTGNLPKFEQDLYKTLDGMYLIPTAEVPMTNLHANEVLEEKDLPKKYTAFTPCFRTEAGRHGAESRGIFRLHQFDKVEMVIISSQETSWKLHEEMTLNAEKILEKLEIPYRRKLLASGDMGFSSAKTYDLEVFAAASNRWLETSSCSNCTDFQARRMNSKYKTKDGVKFVHTLNGSALATPRLLIALLENNQTKNGSIKIPKALHPYMNGIKEIK